MTIEHNKDSDALRAEQKSNDAKLILAPLAKYAAVAVIMVSVIITTAIMLDRELNPIDKNIAALKAELADANALTMTEAAEAKITETATGNATADDAITANTDTSAEDSVVALTTDTTTRDDQTAKAETVFAATESFTATAANSTAKAHQESTATTATDISSGNTEAATKPAELVADYASPTQAANQAETVKASRASRIDYLKASFHARIADRNNYLKTLDSRSLEDFRASQQQMIEKMLQQITRQQEIIEQMRARNQDAYEMRAASIKRMQQARDRSLEKI